MIHPLIIAIRILFLYHPERPVYHQMGEKCSRREKRTSTAITNTLHYQ